MQTTGSEAGRRTFAREVLVLGIGNIRQCVDRCHGLLEIDDGSRLPQDQRIFCIDILLPNRI